MKGAMMLSPFEACHQLTMHLWSRLDARNYSATAALFVDDGIWVRRNAPCQGHKAIIASLEQRSKTMQIRHIVSNLTIEFDESKVAQLCHYLTVYQYDDGVAVQVPAPLGAPFAVMTNSATAVQQRGQWRFNWMSGQVLFKAPS